MVTIKSDLIRLENVGKNFGKKQVLESVTLAITPATITTIIGPNGSGKTSLAKIILGLIKPSSGKIWRKDSIRVGYVPQTIHFPTTMPLTALEFIKASNHSFDKEYFQELKEKLRLDKIMDKQVHILSGGELQRLLLISALLSKPEILILDEPVEGVDFTIKLEIYKLLEEIKNRFRTSILMISHDLYTVMKSTNMVICLNKHICCAGLPGDISKNPAYLELFGTDTAANIAIYSHHHNHIHE